MLDVSIRVPTVPPQKHNPRSTYEEDDIGFRGQTFRPCYGLVSRKIQKKE